jgi:NAD(P)-dependent dehydrogenase (short-subunit alcohol dehydrogenase family)
MRLKGKTAMITGAGSGMGKAMAVLFAQEGANVVACDINGQSVEELVRTIREAGGQASSLVFDVTEEEPCKDAVDEILDCWGSLDVLVTNPWWQPFKPLHETSTVEWEKTLNVTLNGVYYCCKYAVQAMLRNKRGGGSVINNGSVRGFAAASTSAAYMAAKGAVSQLTKSIAMDYGAKGIRANVLCPGIIATPPTVESMSDEKMWQSAAARPMLKRIGTAEEVAYAALFLASDESSYITGTELIVDGGLTGQV